MPSYPVRIIALILLIVASIGPKLWLQRRAAQVDMDRLDREMRQRLEAANFQVTIDEHLAAAAVRAERQDCRLIVRNGDRARELGAIFRLEASRYGPVMIGYRNHWSSRPAGARAVMERFAQDGAARLGVQFARPAVIAMARSGPCSGVQQLFRDLLAHSTVTRSIDDPVA